MHPQAENRSSFFQLGTFACYSTDVTESDKFAALRRGLLEHLVLTVISVRQVYASEVLQSLSEGGFPTQEGTLYPLLSKMRRAGLLDYEWQESAVGPPRKYYTLTNTGRRQLSEFRAYWSALTALIEKIGR